MRTLSSHHLTSRPNLKTGPSAGSALLRFEVLVSQELSRHVLIVEVVNGTHRGYAKLGC